MKSLALILSALMIDWRGNAAPNKEAGRYQIHDDGVGKGITFYSRAREVALGRDLAVDNEAELAVVMAHEIAHVLARHYTRQASWSEILNYAAIPLMFI